MSDLPPFLTELLDSCPTADGGVNTWLYSVGRQLHAHMDERAMFALLKQKSQGCGRVVNDSEIAHQIMSSRRTAWCPRNPEMFAHADDLKQDANLPPMAPAWPKPDLERIRRIVSDRFLLSDLRQQSPVKFEGDDSHTEEIIDAIWPGNPLLCCGKNAYKDFATRRREVWRGNLSRCAFIVPNPQLKVLGRTKEGKESQHTLESTGRRIYHVIEFDFAEFAPDGSTETNLTPLVREWQTQGITVGDACAALHLHLSVARPLVLVTHSGGKSLHGWYGCFDRTTEQNRQFMEYAVMIGAVRLDF